jgi:hypothetical protein
MQQPAQGQPRRIIPPSPVNQQAQPVRGPRERTTSFVCRPSGGGKADENEKVQPNLNQNRNLNTMQQPGMANKRPQNAMQGQGQMAMVNGKPVLVQGQPKQGQAPQQVADWVAFTI